MSRFLIEVPHEEDESACVKAIRIFLRTGSHFLTKADWGCKDGEHKAWIIVDVDEKEEARAVVPQPYRSEAKVTRLSWFTLDESDGLKEHHQG